MMVAGSMSELEEGPPVCFACEFEKRGFPCRGVQGEYLMDKVARAFCEHYRLSGAPDAWAAECVSELVMESPQMALDFILRALAVFETDEDLALLAAGPLEDLLDYHSQDIIDRLEAEAASSARFRLLLSGVRVRPNVRPEIRRRLQIAILNGPRPDRALRGPQGSED
jgi:hypothetical protein